MKFVKSTILAVLSLLVLSPVVYANVGESAGFVIAAQGTLTAVDQNGKSRELTRRSQFYANETLKTGSDSQAQLRFKDRALMTLKPNSELNIGQYHFGGVEDPSNTAVMKLVAGGFRTISGSIGKSNKSAYRIETPAASIGIRGTDYELIISIDGKLFAAVHAGGITIVNDLGDLDLGADSDYLFAEVSTGNTPKGLDELPDVFKVQDGEKKELTEEQKELLQKKLAEKEDKLMELLAAFSSDAGLNDGDLQLSIFDEALANDNSIDTRIDPDLLEQLKSGRYAVLVNGSGDGIGDVISGRSIKPADGQRLFLGEEGQLLRYDFAALTENNETVFSGHSNVDWGIWKEATLIGYAGVESKFEKEVVWMDAEIYDEAAIAERTGTVTLSGLSGFYALSSHPDRINIEGSSAYLEMDFNKQTIDGSVSMILSDSQTESSGYLNVEYNGDMYKNGDLNNDFDAQAALSFGEEENYTLMSGVTVKGTMVQPVGDSDPGFAGFFSARLPWEGMNLGVQGLWTMSGSNIILIDGKPSFMK